MYEIRLTVPKSGGRWSDSLNIENYRSFFLFLSGALSLIEPKTVGDDNVHQKKCLDDNGNEEDEQEDEEEEQFPIKEDDINDLIDFISAMMASSPKFLLTSLEKCNDQYADCPLVVLAFGLATLIAYKRSICPLQPDAYMNRTQQEIPFCVLNGLFCGSRQPIKDFNIEELTNSMTQMEQKAHILHYSSDMFQYIDALEERVCEMLLHANTSDIFNKREWRVPFSDGLYTCATDVEFRLVISIISLRRISSASLFFLRREAVIYNEDTDEDAAATEKSIEYLERAIVNKCDNIHSDYVQDDFESLYKENCMSPSEVYMFFKINTPDTRVDCTTVVQTFRNIAHWHTITEAATVSIDEYIFEKKDENSMAFQIVFLLVLNIIMKQTMDVEFTEFWVEGYTIYDMDATLYSQFCESSKKTPYFVRSIGEACVFFDGTLYVFGQGSKDYYRALAFWIKTVASECKGIVGNGASIHDFLDYICDETINPPIDLKAMREQERIRKEAERKAQSYAASSSSLAHLLPPDERRRQRGYDLFVRVKKSLQAEQQAVDSMHSVGDIESTGLPSSSKSGW